MNSCDRGLRVRALFQFLNESGVRYCVLGDTRDYPDRIRGDIDIAVPAAALAGMPGLLFRFCHSERLQLVQILGREQTAMYVVLAWTEAESNPCFLAIDLCSDYRRHGGRILASEAILYRSKPAVDAAGRRKGFPVPEPATQFIYYLVKKVDKLRLDRRQGDYLTACWRADADACEAQIRRFWPDDVALMSQAAASGDWSAVQSALPGLRMKLRRSLVLPFRYRPQEWSRKVTRAMHPNGLMVEVFGADCCDRSSLIDEVLKDMAPAFRDSCYLNLQPGMQVHKDMRRTVSPMHERWNPAASCGRLLRRLFDPVIGCFLTVQLRKARSTLIIVERHGDVPRPWRHRYDVSAAVWMTGRWLPEPDLRIFLDTAIRRAASRDAQIAPTQTRVRGDGYPVLLQGMHANVVDASGDIRRAARDIEQMILECLVRRVQRRYVRYLKPSGPPTARLASLHGRRFRS